ncbi:NAD(P)H-binding protein [Phytomonospora sp. NPDC050363]|uniref:SDR family oxidoreductase n=1 Tax=Phytomonospora sp. NPDC050363 TaxID=3155642 RepID=UPI0033DB69CD
MTILVTGARGRVARAAVARLTAAGADVRAAGSDPSATPPLEGVGVIGLDLADPASVKAALDGVDRVFTYAPRGDFGGFLAAAADAGVERVVMLSSIAAAYPGNPIGDLHLAAENPLRESGIPFTILRPGMFASNSLGWAESIRAEGVIRSAFPRVHGTPIHEDDMADVAVTALTGPGHAGKTYALGGPESLDEYDRARIIGEAIGREVRIELITIEEALAVGYEPVVRAMAEAGTDPLAPGPLSQDVTGIPSRTFVQWARDHAGDFR